MAISSKAVRTVYVVERGDFGVRGIDLFLTAEERVVAASLGEAEVWFDLDVPADVNEHTLTNLAVDAYFTKMYMFGGACRAVDREREMSKHVCLNHLGQYDPTSQVAGHYDTDPVFRENLCKLVSLSFVEFEYPDWSGLTVQKAIAKASRLIGEAEPIDRELETLAHFFRVRLVGVQAHGNMPGEMPSISTANGEDVPPALVSPPLAGAAMLQALLTDLMDGTLTVEKAEGFGLGNARKAFTTASRILGPVMRLPEGRKFTLETDVGVTSDSGAAEVIPAGAVWISRGAYHQGDQDQSVVAECEGTGALLVRTFEELAISGCLPQ